MKQYGIVTDHWSTTHLAEVRNWLVGNFGPGGFGGPNCDKRWGEEFDYGLENLYMDEDVYLIYCLKWQ